MGLYISGAIDFWDKAICWLCGCASTYLYSSLIINHHDRQLVEEYYDDENLTVTRPG